MFKRILATSLMVGAVVVGSSDAFASRARLIAQGTNDPFGALGRGSFFYEDNNNMFYNPAYVNDFKNWAAIEKSNGATNGTNPTGFTNSATAVVGTGAGTEAEGGFVTGLMGFNFGMYFNRGDALTLGPHSAGTGTYYANTPMYQLRPIDITFGGDMGAKWGVGLTYANAARTGDNNSTQALIVKAGAEINDIEPFLNWQVVGCDQTTVGTTVVKNKPTFIDAGVRYHYGEWIPFGMWRMDNNKQAEVDAKQNTWILGVGRSAKLGDATHLMYAVSMQNHNSRNVYPLDMSVESELLSWLVGRAGFTYRFWWNDVATGDVGSARLGATIKFGKVNFDWAVGGGTAASNGDPNKNVFDIGSGFFTNASMTYAW